MELKLSGGFIKVGAVDAISFDVILKFYVNQLWFWYLEYLTLWAIKYGAIHGVIIIRYAEHNCRRSIIWLRLPMRSRSTMASSSWSLQARDYGLSSYERTRTSKSDEVYRSHIQAKLQVCWQVLVPVWQYRGCCCDIFWLLRAYRLNCLWSWV